MKETWNEKLFGYSNLILLGFIGLISLFPFYYIMVVSFTDSSEYLSSRIILFPKQFTLDAYQYIFSSRIFVTSLGVSGYLAVVGTILSLIVTAAFGYMISRKRLVGRKVITTSLIITILFQPGMIPNYLIINELGLMNSLWSIILPGMLSGWNALLLKTFFENIPESLEESAYMDGANDLKIFFQIILPLSLPAMATFGLFFAVGYWNTFFSAVLYITDDTKWPLQVLLQSMIVQSSTGIADPSVAANMSADQTVTPQIIKMAAIVIATIPILMVYPFLQKHFTKGVMLGSVKG
ncbi:carbohydrate ABC transporter permease [Paenibacillus sp. GCM10023252]|uniref:carbohydrate ABC transporter permease n=1 Tax=Paenibacillus sp. GCM10023252 TaxID=3252649 RepID=UPI00360AC097